MAVKVVLDANVLYSARLRDLLIELGVAGVLHPIWTRRIEREWIDAVLRRRPDLSERLPRTVARMRRALPDACVDIDRDAEDGIALPDPGDAHVVAAALASGARCIVTFNAADFPNRVLRPLGLEAASPDDVLIACSELDPEGVLIAVATVRARLRAPAVSESDYVAGLTRAGCPRFAAWLIARVAII